MKEVAQLQSTAGPSPFPSPKGRDVKCEVTPISWAQAIRLIGPICLLLGLFPQLSTTCVKGVKCEVTPISWAQAIRLIGPICPLSGLFSELNTTWGSMLIPHEYVKSFRHI